jgi:peptide-methionine (R)-S-oxide reductase
VKGFGLRVRVTAESLGLQALAGKKIPHKIGGQQTQVMVHFAGMMIKIVMCEIIHGAHKGTSVRIKTFLHLALLILHMRFCLIITCIATLFACGSGKTPAQSIQTAMQNNNDALLPVPATEEEWKQRLSPEEYRVLRQKGTERPFSSPFEQVWDSGTYVCKGCGNELFRSETKFDAGCGWPSFYETIDKSKVKEIVDYSHNMIRTEVVCARCGGHLGHVFNDGYGQPTGLRYCINGVSLGFRKK